MATDAEAIFKEAVSALGKGEKSRARDLLTRLIKQDGDNAEYWLWMSAAVESIRERTYCLKEVLRVDPENKAARRGLILIGAMEPDESLAMPFKDQKRDWQANLKSFSDMDLIFMSGVWRPFAMVGGGLVLLALISAAIWFFTRPKPAEEIPYYFIPSRTAEIFITYAPGDYPALPPLMEPTPLANFMLTTYTPTPLVVDTPHPRTETYRGAMFAYQKGDWGGVIEKMNELLGEEPDAYDAHYYIGEAYRNLGDTNQALQAYGKALLANEQFTPAYLGRARARLGQSADSWPAAREDLVKAITIDSNFAPAHLELAALDIRRGEPELALESLDAAAEWVQTSPLLYLNYAKAYLVLGENEKAIENARQAKHLDETMLEVYRVLGETYFANGNTYEALVALRIYTVYESEDDQAWAWQGASYAEYGDMDAALAAFDRAFEIDKNSSHAYYQRGQVYYNQEEFEFALRDFISALNTDGASYEANMGAGKALMALDEPGRASTYFDRAKPPAKTDAHKAELYYWRAQSMEAIDEPAAAARDWHTLVDLPSGAASEEWLEMAEARIKILATSTPTVSTRTPSDTLMPTLTASITTTRKPTLTLTLTPTRQSTFTPTAIPSGTPSPTAAPTITSTPTPGPSQTPTKTPVPFILILP
jgi:tetratricopeptide (TPR) repeat protein